ncbi:MAG: zf-HC2 domain-containing protein [Phycisphaerae bacterium]|nr:zf-HC2 domain-containing protein [Phycisphaerae bacterium]
MSPVNRDNLDELLSAYLDGELTEPERAEVDALLKQDVSVRRRLEALQGTLELISALPRRSAPPSLMEDVMSRLERDELLEDLNTSRPRRGWQRPWLSVLASAALVAICVSGAWYIFQAPARSREQSSPAVAVHTSPATPGPERASSKAEAPMAREGVVADGLTAEPKSFSTDGGSKSPRRPAARPDTAVMDRSHVSWAEKRGEKDADKRGAVDGQIAETVDRTARRSESDRAAGATPSRERRDENLAAELRLESIGYASGATTATAEAPVPAVPASSAGIPESTFADAVADMWERGMSELRHLSDDSRATVDQKLADGASPTDVVHHPFANEKAQVQVAFATEAARQAAAERLARILDEQAVPEVRQTAFLNFLGLAPALGRTSPFFILGQPTVNFSDAREQQILVRMAPQHVGQLFDALVASADAERDVTVRVGSAAARGRAAGFDLLTLGLPVFEARATAVSEPARADGRPLGSRAVEPQRALESAERTDLQAEEDDYSVSRAETVVDATAPDETVLPGSEFRQGRSTNRDELRAEPVTSPETARAATPVDAASLPVKGAETYGLSGVATPAPQEWGPFLTPDYTLSASGTGPLVTVVIRLLPPGGTEAQPAVTPEAPVSQPPISTPTTRPSSQARQRPRSTRADSPR